MSSDFRVTLLGTGHPAPLINRFGPSILVEAGDTNLVFDCGRGTMQRLFQINRNAKHFDKLFLTHLHSDHTTGIPDLWVTGFLLGRSENPLKIWGPKGTRQMIEYLKLAFTVDTQSRLLQTPNTGLGINAEDLDEGFILDENGVKITPFKVPHYLTASHQCFGYRVDYMGRSVVISGDTQYSENLIKHSLDVDLLVHEVAAVPSSHSGEDWFTQIVSVHTNPEEAGRIFSEVNPRIAVFTHILQLHGVTLDEIMSRTKRIYNGQVVIGEDMMTFDIGDTVQVSNR
jgi:ribonuclease Z